MLEQGKPLQPKETESTSLASIGPRQIKGHPEINSDSPSSNQAGEITVFEPKKETAIRAMKRVLGNLIDGLVEDDNPTLAEEENLSKRQRYKKKVKRKLGTTLAKPFMEIGVGPIMRGVESKWMPVIKREIPEVFEEALNERMKNPNAILVVPANHYDHAQLMEMMFNSRMLIDMVNKVRDEDNLLKGTKLIVAKSLGDGLQNAFVQAALKRAEKNYFSKYNLSTIACVSKNDQERRNMDIHENAEFFRYLINLSKTKDEILEIFVEGSVDGGRLMNGKRNGMRPLIPELDRIFEILTKNGAELVFAPFASWGPNRIHTDSKLPTSAAIKSLFFNKNPENLTNIKFGMPITLTEIKQQILKLKGQEATQEDIRDYLGRTCIAPLAPPDFQGVFRKV